MKKSLLVLIRALLALPAEVQEKADLLHNLFGFMLGYGVGKATGMNPKQIDIGY